MIELIFFVFIMALICGLVGLFVSIEASLIFFKIAIMAFLFLWLYIVVRLN